MKFKFKSKSYSLSLGGLRQLFEFPRIPVEQPSQGENAKIVADDQPFQSPHLPSSEPITQVLDTDHESMVVLTPAPSNVALELAVAHTDLEAFLELFPPLRSVVSGLRVCVTLTDLYVVDENRREYENVATDLTIVARNLQTHAALFSEGAMPHSARGIMKEVRQLLIQTKLERERLQVKVATPTDILADQEIMRYRTILSLLRQLQTDIRQTYNDAWEQLMRTTIMHQNGTPALNALHNASLQMEIHPHTHTPSTYQDILDTIQTWATKTDGPKVLWMTGMTGSGKTTIAHTICDQLDREKWLGASYFCSVIVPDCRDAKRIIPTIVYQLARSSKPYWDALSRPSAVEPDDSEDIITQYNRLLAIPLTRAKNALPKNPVVVIDGLDECDDISSVQAILELLVRHANELPLKFLLASHPDLIAILPPFPDNASIQFCDINQSTNIHLYLNEVLTPTVSLDSVNKLAELAGCQFIFATTAVRYILGGLSENQHIGSMNRLSTLLDTTVHSNGTSNTKLDMLYTAILSDIFDDESSVEVNSRQLVLWTVVQARELMTATAIVERLVLITHEDLARAIWPLRPVLRLNNTTGVVSLRHTSFREFLLDPRRSGKYYYHESGHTEFLAVRCFMVMQKSLRFNICGFETSTIPDKDVPDLQGRVAKAIPPILSNACRYWFEYLENAASSSRIFECLDDFIRRRLLFWMEVLNLKGWIIEGNAMLLQVLDWVLQAEVSNKLELQKLILDACDFVRSYSDSPASDSTLHIYISALPFTRRESYIYDAYWAQTRGLGAPADAPTRVSTTAFSPDHTRVISGSQNGTIRIWDIVKASQFYETISTASQLLMPSSAHSRPITAVAFSPLGTQAVSASEDGVMCVWNIQRRSQLTEPNSEYSQPIISRAFSPDIDLAQKEHGRYRRITRPWNLHKRGRLLPSACSQHIMSIAFSPDSARVVSRLHDETICVWDVLKGFQLVLPASAHPRPIVSLAFSLDNTRAVSWSEDSTMCIWDIQEQSRLLGPLFAHSQPIKSVAFLSDGNRLVSWSQDGTMRVWDIKKASQLLTLASAYSQTITSIVISLDGTRLVSGSQDGTVHVWDIWEWPQLLGSVTVHSKPITSIGSSPDGTRIVFGFQNDAMYIWDLQKQSQLLGPISFAFLPDGTQAEYWSENDTFFVWDIVKRSFWLAEKDPGGSQPNKIITFSRGVALSDSWFFPNSIRKAEVSIRPFNTGNEATTQQSTGNNGAVDSTSPNGNGSISGSSIGGILVWDPHSGAHLFGPLQQHGDIISSISLSPDGNRIISGSNDGTICFWDIHDSIDRQLAQPHEETRIITNGCNLRIDEKGWVENSQSRLLWLSPESIERLSHPSLSKSSDANPLCLYISRMDERFLPTPSQHLTQKALNRRLQEPTNTTS